MTHSPSARSIADIERGVILARVDIAATPDRVFRALTDSNEIPRWWGSAEVYQTETWTTDFKVGGTWKAEGRGADGVPFSVSGTFLEIDPPRKVVQTWKADWDGGHETRLTYELAATEAGTRLTVRHEGFAGRTESCEQHAAGWEMVLGWLQSHLQPSIREGERLLRV